MSVLQPISYGLVHQIGPGNGARGFGSYKADNTETMRPYQQESSSPIGRAYPMGIVSGRPTVYDPAAGIREDPVVTLLKKLLGEKPVVAKAPDAGFKTNLPLQGGDEGMGGGGGGGVVVKRMYPEVDVKQEFSRLHDTMNRTTQNERSVLNTIAQGFASAIVSGAASGVMSAGSELVSRTTGGFNVANIPMTHNLAFDAIMRQALPAAYAESAISISRGITDLITTGERTLSDYLYRPVQYHANEGARIVYNRVNSAPAATTPDLPTATIGGLPVELVNSARDQWYYGEVSANTIASIVENIQANAPHLTVMSLNAIAMRLLASLNPGGYVRTIQGLRNIPRVNYAGM